MIKTIIVDAAVALSMLMALGILPRHHSAPPSVKGAAMTDADRARAKEVRGDDDLPAGTVLVRYGPHITLCRRGKEWVRCDG